MKLEIVGTNLDDVDTISKSKADRIEFCSHMEQGGLTPKRSLVRKALKIKGAKPIKVMIRPTSKTFNYSRWQYFKMVCSTIRFCWMKKVDGLVFGILNKDNDIDINRMGRLIHICKWYRKTVTFHKAIELVPNQQLAFETLHELGVETALTNGGTKDQEENIELLKTIKAEHEVTLLVGGGITEKNCKAYSKVADEIHVGSAVRHDQDWKKRVDIAAVNRIKEKIS